MDRVTIDRLEKLVKDRERRRQEQQRLELRKYQRKSRSSTPSTAGFHYEPVSNGASEIVFADGDVVMALVPD